MAAVAPNLRAYISNSVNKCSSSVIKDIESRLFCDFDCERYRGDLHGTIIPESNNTSKIPQEELLARSASHRNGDLPRWKYEHAFEDVEVQNDNTDIFLEAHYITETNKIIDRVMSEYVARLMSSDELDSPIHPDTENTLLTPLACVRSFIIESLLEKLKHFANRSSLWNQRKPTTAKELLGIIFFHVLSAFCNESPSTLVYEEENGNFLQINIAPERYFEV